VQPFQQPNLRGCQPGVPEIDDEDDAVLRGVIPSLVLEIVIEHQTPPLLPLPGVVTDAQRTVSGRHRDPEMTPQSQVRGPAVGTDMRSGSHPRHIDQPTRRPHRRQSLDPTSRDRTRFAHLLAPSAALVEERHVPVAQSLDALTLTVKPGWLQSENLFTDLGEVRLKVAGQRKVRRIVPRP
jgi:hypothetical protein